MTPITVPVKPDHHIATLSIVITAIAMCLVFIFISITTIYQTPFSSWSWGGGLLAAVPVCQQTPGAWSGHARRLPRLDYS